MREALRPQRALATVAVYQPILNRNVLLAADATTPIAGVVDNTGGTPIEFVRAIIVNTVAEADAKVAEALGPGPYVGWTDCVLSGVVPGEFSHSGVPVDPPTVSDDRYLQLWVRVGGTPDFARVPFTAFANQEGTSVSAKACIWFFGVGSAISGPWQEDATSAPLAIPVPDDAQSVRVSAAGAWRKRGGGPMYGPNGNPNDFNPLVNCNASDCSKWYDLLPTPGGHPITKENYNKGLLVGVWDVAEDSKFKQYAIGEQWSSSVPEGASQLYLGFHDGFQWTNNEGHVRALVTFS